MKLLRFLLTYGQFIDVVASPIEANEWVDRWQSGLSSLKDEKYMGGVDRMGRRWCLLTDQLIGVVCQDLPVEMEQTFRQQSKQPGITFPPTSGRN